MNQVGKRTRRAAFVGALTGATILGGVLISAAPAGAASGVPSAGGQDATSAIGSNTIDLIGYGISAFSDDPWTSLTVTNKTWETQRVVAIAQPYQMRYNGPGVGAELPAGKSMAVGVSPDTFVTMDQDAGVTLQLLGTATGEVTTLTIKVNFEDEPSPGYRKGTYVLAKINGQLVSQVYRNASTNTIPAMPSIDLVPGPRQIRR